MRCFWGETINRGVAIGTIQVYKKQNTTIIRVDNENVQDELKRLNDAIELSKIQLQELYQKVFSENGKSSAEIFSAHQMILLDEEYIGFITGAIRNEKKSVEYAISVAKHFFSKMFASMEDEFMQGRAEDVKDVSDRLLRNLMKMEEKWSCYAPCILVAEEITPSEFMQLDRNKILALVVRSGSSNSHVAILAKTMNLPTLINVEFNIESLNDGELVIVDAVRGCMVLNPDENQLAYAKNELQEEQERLTSLKKLIGKDSVTLNGYKIGIYANAGTVEEVQLALENDAEGIGLFRSECLYLDRKDLPDEEEQYRIYKNIIQQVNGKKVIIRTLDVGGDKQLSFLENENERNPALGCRGIRMSLKEQEVFKTQLRALLRASIYGDVSIMYPMITSTDELNQVYSILEDIKNELEADGVRYQVPEQGIMIETPAAVMISDELAEMVDFFSIGTNDLTQYSLAIDRQNESLNAFYNPRHKAILRMIQMVVENAHLYGKRVGICGELASDTELAEIFIQMGVDELSVVPSEILELRSVIRKMDI